MRLILGEVSEESEAGYSRGERDEPRDVGALDWSVRAGQLRPHSTRSATKDMQNWPRRTTALAILVALLPIIPAAAQRATAIPAPASILGFEPGADRKLPTWKQVTD